MKMAYRPIEGHIKVIDGHVFEKQNIYMASNQKNHKACINLSINRIFDIKSISIMNNKLKIRCATS
jgi:hypothetical protein